MKDFGRCSTREGLELGALEFSSCSVLFFPFCSPTERFCSRSHTILVIRQVCRRGSLHIGLGAMELLEAVTGKNMKRATHHLREGLGMRAALSVINILLLPHHFEAPTFIATISKHNQQWQAVFVGSSNILVQFVSASQPLLLLPLQPLPPSLLKLGESHEEIVQHCYK